MATGVNGDRREHHDLVGWPIALTGDDAPTVAQRTKGPLQADPGRMDSIRETLTRAGVAHCVAYIVGSRCESEPVMDRLRRWLAAGFALGNHGFSHSNASELGPDAFLADVVRCDELLAEVGAFADGRTKWFRFPNLDRGGDVGERQAIEGGLGTMGYRIAPASVDWFDYLFDPCLATAATAGDAAREQRVVERYVSAVVGTCRYEARSLSDAAGRPVPLVAYFHFGPTTERSLPRILERFAGVRWCTQEEAFQDPVYRGFQATLGASGRVVPIRTVGQRLRRHLARASVRLGLFEQGRLGPRWPWLL
jgi:peptidoglycan/xylan/chitin deacetylase (PgdA/CDA1 family)